ncbi:kinase-like protein [Gonapodya prolifera JEL478]|uniref:Kinase-like protein n=1 Tax=Gonapodya prolifera (strain JEL478) TaxID=1344416 RepID=A0A139ATC0_GONPJ|nr:kinase-like protein [Gonapodya prolifera JEL478]|eukprot:KXS19813.1 kinase-like protein [Gonapodya prolifera JEL478]
MKADNSGAPTVLVERLYAAAPISPIAGPLMRDEDGATSHYNFQDSQALLEAAKAGDVSLVVDILKETLDVNVRDVHENTALHVACRAGYAEVLEALLERRPDLEARNIAGDTPLIVATQELRPDLVSMVGDLLANILVKEGRAKLNIANKYGRTPLNIAGPTWEKELKKTYLGDEDVQVAAVKAQDTATLQTPSSTITYPAPDPAAPDVLPGLLSLTRHAETRRARWNGWEVAVKRVGIWEEVPTNTSAKEAARVEEVNLKKRKQLESVCKDEVESLRKLWHGNLLPVIGFTNEPPHNVSIMTEYSALGSLHAHLSNPEVVIDEQAAYQLALGAARGVAYLHSQVPPVPHGNLKSRNMLVYKGNQVKLVEYGFAVSPFATSPNAANLGSHAGKYVTDPTSVPPEVLKGNFEPCYDARWADSYAFGMVLHQVATRAPTWPENWGPMTIGLKVVLENTRPEIPEYVPEPLADLIRRCWDSEPRQRPDFRDIVSVLEELLRDADRRSGVVSPASPAKPTVIVQQKQAPKVAVVVESNEFKSRKGSIGRVFSPVATTNEQ